MSKQGKPQGYDDLIAALEALPVILRETRRRKGLSTRAAAGQLGVTFATVNRWERGNAQPTRPAIIRILRWAAE